MVLTIPKRKSVPWAQFVHCVCKHYHGKNISLSVYTSYIFLWNGTESELIKFTDNLNQKHHTIKFEFTYSRTSITFLDTKIYENENGTLRIAIYRKPSDRRNFLHFKWAQKQ